MFKKACLPILIVMISFFAFSCKQNSEKHVHSYDYSNPIWEWNGVEEASVSFNCLSCEDKVDGHTISYDATIYKNVVSEPTCIEDGVYEYIASIEINNQVFKDSKTISVDALGHNYNSLEYSGNYKFEYIAFDSFDTNNLKLYKKCSRCNDRQEVDLTSCTISYIDPNRNYFLASDNEITINVKYTNLNVKIPVVVNKKEIVKPAKDETNFVYNGQEFEYIVEASDFYYASGTKRTNAGNYIVTISLKDPVNTKWENGDSNDLFYDFVINRAPNTISGIKSSYETTCHTLPSTEGIVTKEGEISFAVFKDQECKNPVAITAMEEGDYYIRAESDGGTNYIKCYTDAVPLHVEHKFDQKNTNKQYIFKPATLMDDAIYYYSCLCGQKGIETFVLENSKLPDPASCSHEQINHHELVIDGDHGTVEHWECEECKQAWADENKTTIIGNTAYERSHLDFDSYNALEILNTYYKNDFSHPYLLFNATQVALMKIAKVASVKMTIVGEGSGFIYPQAYSKNEEIHGVSRDNMFLENINEISSESKTVSYLIAGALLSEDFYELRFALQQDLTSIRVSNIQYLTCDEVVKNYYDNHSMLTPSNSNLANVEVICAAKLSGKTMLKGDFYITGDNANSQLYLQVLNNINVENVAYHDITVTSESTTQYINLTKALSFDSTYRIAVAFTKPVSELHFSNMKLVSVEEMNIDLINAEFEGTTLSDGSIMFNQGHINDFRKNGITHLKATYSTVTEGTSVYISSQAMMNNDGWSIVSELTGTFPNTTITNSGQEIVFDFTDFMSYRLDGAIPEIVLQIRIYISGDSSASSIKMTNVEFY